MISLCSKVVLLIGFIAGLAESSETSELEECQDGWVAIHRGCYRFVEENMEWESARDYCKNLNGELTSIQSVKEKEGIETYMSTHDQYRGVSEWWIGFQKEGSKIEWLARVPVDESVISWANRRWKSRPGNWCGILDQSRGLRVHLGRCTDKKPFMCEFHAITDRPSYQTVITEAPTELPMATTPPLDSGDAPTAYPSGDADCPCRESEDASEGDARESPELRLRRRNHALGLSMDEGLYADYLQSEIDANRAKIAYFAQVAKVYEDTLKAQSDFYESYQRRMETELAQLSQGTQCNSA